MDEGGAARRRLLPRIVLAGLAAATLAAAATLVVAIAGCGPRERPAPERAPARGEDSTMTRRPLSAVLAEHTPALMAIPGVVGTGEGREGDRPVVLVLVVRDTPELRARLPHEIEGFPVVIRVTGEVRGLRKP